MTVVEIARFVIAGEPVSKSRARFTKWGSKVHAYTPEKTLAAEHRVAAAFRTARPGWQPVKETAYGVAASFYQANRQRRDVDNMLKLILDGLNGTAWGDDVQVSEVAGRKAYVPAKDEARTEVVIYDLGPIVRPQTECKFCGKSIDIYPSTRAVRKFCNQECHLSWRRQRRTLNCELCDVSFESTEAGRRFCSITCLLGSHRFTATCSECGTSYPEAISNQRRKTFWCGPECREITRKRLLVECVHGHPKSQHQGVLASGKRYCRKCNRLAVARRKANG